MQFVTTTPVALLLFAAILWLGPIRGLPLFFVTMPFAGSAAFIAGGLGNVSMTDLGILALWMSLLGRPVGLSRVLGSMRPGLPGLPLLLLMCVVTIGAIFLPRIFAGRTEFFSLARVGELLLFTLQPLRPTGSNIGQLARMLLATSTFVVLASVCAYYGRPAQALRAVTVATTAHVIVSLVGMLSHAFGMPNLLDVVQTARYEMLDNQVVMGIRRIVGAFPEPSAFSYYTVGLYGFWLSLWFHNRGSRWLTVTLALVTFLLLRSLSTSGMVNFVAFTGLFLLWHLRAIARRNRTMSIYLGLTMVIPLAIGLVVLLFNFVPAVPDMLDSLVFNKLNSDSGEERMSWNVQALQNFLDSYGLGVGIGSVRASSWLMTNLGSIGIVGSALQAWFLFAMFQYGRDMRHLDTAANDIATALKTGCMAMLLQAVISKPYPNLETPFYAMAGIAVGLLVHQRRRLAATRVEAEGPLLREPGPQPVFRHRPLAHPQPDTQPRKGPGLA